MSASVGMCWCESDAVATFLEKWQVPSFLEGWSCEQSWKRGRQTLFLISFFKVRLICHSVFLPPLLSVTVIPKTSSLVSKFSVSRFHVLYRCCARRWRDGAAGNSTAGSDDSGKCFHLQRQVLKVITKGWRHRAHPDRAAQPRPLRRRRSAGVSDELSSFVLAQREGSPLSLIPFRAS